jgi:hypothetical protein
MFYCTTNVSTLREASRRWRAFADASDDGLSALSYAQLADEIDGMIDLHETAIAPARAEKRLSRSTYSTPAAQPIRRSGPSPTFAVGGQR